MSRSSMKEEMNRKKFIQRPINLTTSGYTSSKPCHYVTMIKYYATQINARGDCSYVMHALAIKISTSKTNLSIKKHTSRGIQQGSE